MNINRQKGNWLLDLLLFAGFLVSFFLDLTGLPLHQWIGAIGAALLSWHLILHWNWVKAITARFFGKTSGQARVYYLLDVTIVAGFLLILISGLVISTWLNFPLANYLGWKEFHVTVSLTTLAIVVLKIALHWRWIIRTAQQPLLPPSRLPPRPSPAAAGISRKDFLKLIGIVGAASMLAAYSALSNGQEAQASNLSASPSDETALHPTSTRQESSPWNMNSGGTKNAVPTQAEVTPTFSPLATPTTMPTDSIPPCIVRCSNHCSYPGSCRRYQDTNGNGFCDLGECL